MNLIQKPFTIITAQAQPVSSVYLLSQQMFHYTTSVSSSLRISASWSEEKRTTSSNAPLFTGNVVNSAEAVPYGPIGLCMWVWGCGVDIVNRCRTWQHITRILARAIIVSFSISAVWLHQPNTIWPQVGPSLSECTCTLLTFAFEFELCTSRTSTGLSPVQKGHKEKWK